MPHTRSISLASVVALALPLSVFAQSTPKPTDDPPATPASPTTPVKTPIKPAQPTKDSTKQPPKPKPARKYRVNPNAKFPEPITTKKLWASNDFRTKPAPAIEADKWLTPEQPRENKVVVLAFLATFAENSRHLLNDLKQWQNKYDDEIAVVGMFEEAEDKSAAYVSTNKIEFPAALDRQKRVNRALGIETLPYVIVISSDGVTRWQGFPMANEDRLTDDTVKQIIEADRAMRAKAAAEQERAKNPPKPAPKGKQPKDKQPEPAAPSGG